MTLSDYLTNPCRMSSLPYWKLDRGDMLSKVSVHHGKDCLDLETCKNAHQRYFRLIHHLEGVAGPSVDVRTIDISADLDALSLMINTAYGHEGIRIGPGTLRGYMTLPVFDPMLWVKIEENGQIIASGIACFDPLAKEGTLEWIQVLQDHRHKGYGRLIVNSLLERLSTKASFVTVSGRLGNSTDPERLYRTTGFQGDDVWHVITDPETEDTHDF
jgi:GNAT superfamily N-acetyltransferase